MFIHLHKRGQSTLEYAVIIAVIVAGLIAMQTYIKRGLQGKLKQSADDIGEQFSPGYTASTSNITSNVTSTEAVSGGSLKSNASPITKTTSNQTQSRAVNEQTETLDKEYNK